MAVRLYCKPIKLTFALKSGTSIVIVVIVSSIQNQFFASVIKSMEDGMRNCGCGIILIQSGTGRWNNGLTFLEIDEICHFQAILKQRNP